MVTQITHKHFCNLGALRNPNCFSRFNSLSKKMEYFYSGILSESCWMGYKE